MPEINIHGKASPFGTTEDWANARSDNSNFDQMRKSQRSQADLENRLLEDSMKATRDKLKLLNIAIQAQERSSLDLAKAQESAAKALSAATMKSQREETKKFTDQYRMAQYENNDRRAVERKRTSTENSIRRQREKQAKQEEQSFSKEQRELNSLLTQRMRGSRSQSTLERRAADKKWREDYSLANYENQQFDARKRRPGMFGYAAYGAARMIGGRGLAGRVSGLMGYGGGAMEMGGMIGGAGRLLGGAGVVLGGMYELGKQAYLAPQHYASALAGQQSVADQYLNPVISSANIGRAGKFNGRDLFKQMYTGAHFPEWMSSLGLTSQGQGLGVLGAYGGPIRSAGMGRSVLEAAGGMSMAPGIGGMPVERYAQNLGTMKTLGAVNPNSVEGHPEWGVSFSQYQRTMEKTYATAVGEGISNAQVFDNIENLLKASVSMGSPRSNVGSMSDFYLKYLTSGAPSARTGQMQMNALQMANQSAEGLGMGGNSARNASESIYLSRKFKGGAPKSADEFSKAFGVNYSQLAPYQKEIADNAYQAYSHGAAAPAFSYMISIMSSEQKETHLRSIAKSGSEGLPSYLRPMGEANVAFGPGSQGIATYGAGPHAPDMSPDEISGLSNPALTPGDRKKISGLNWTPAIEESYQELKREGLSDATSYGILGSWAGVEANQNGTIDDNQGGGIFQLTGDSLDKFKKMHGGKDPSQFSITEQTKFYTQDYLKDPSIGGKGVWNQVNSATDPYSAGYINEKYGERPAAGERMGVKAGLAAQRLAVIGGNVPRQENGVPAYAIQGQTNNTGVAAGEGAASAMPEFQARPVQDVVYAFTQGTTAAASALDNFTLAVRNATSSLSPAHNGPMSRNSSLSSYSPQSQPVKQ